MKTITLPRFNDMHVHFRLGQMLKNVAPVTARYCSRAVVMPNTLPRPILNADNVIWYRDEINRALEDAGVGLGHFTPYMTIKIRDDTTPKMIHSAVYAGGAIAGKVYPKGVTTNSDDGLTSFQNISKTLSKMEDSGMVLLLHGELDLERTIQSKWEAAFLPKLEWLSANFPDLKIVLEHVSSADAVRAVLDLPDNVAATITAHHLVLTENDVIGAKVRPHNACRPMPKGFTDRDLLLEMAISGNPKFFLGSDSAPHHRRDKECSEGACGIYTAPILPSILAEIFEEHGALEKLEGFTSRHGAVFYDLANEVFPEETFTLVEDPWMVPDEVDGIVPFMAGRTMKYKLA